MKRWPVVILVLMMVLGAVVPGCRHVPHYDGRLTAADSLMRTNPDSALTILEALNSSPARGEVAARAEEGESPARGEVARSDGGGGAEPARGEVARSDGGGGAEPTRKALTSDADLAYRDLLLTQARYKCYITATSDSDINRALAYYRAHPADREKLTRAYIYKGAVMQELGHSDSAMLYYKTAEATAAPDDYFNLGFSNLRIAQLYQRHFANDSAVVARMKNAAHYFMATPDTNYLIIALGTQGSYPRIIGKDSVKIYLEKAILLSRKIHSPKGFQYQSKLAGIYFYDGDYVKAKDLAMDIIRNGSDKCNERQYYYYAARAYIQLDHMDSAQWLLSIAPAPKNAVDSMNFYQSMADLAKATQRYDDYVRYNEVAKSIDTRILEDSRNSQLVETELGWNADQEKRKARSEADSHWETIIGAIILAMLILVFIAVRIHSSRIRDYKRQLASISRELEKMLAETDSDKLKLEKLQENYRHQISEKDNQLAEEKNKRLEQEHAIINSQVSDIIRYRHTALNELYQSVRIKSVTSDGRKRVMPLFSVIKDLFESKGILNRPLSKTFWDNLRLSVDGEFRGITTFMERQYPHLSERDLQLFMLLCAGFPNQIIKICMNYTHDVTVSKYKKKLMKDKIGLDVKFDEFIELYMQGKFTDFN